MLLANTVALVGTGAFEVSLDWDGSKGHSWASVKVIRVSMAERPALATNWSGEIVPVIFPLHDTLGVRTFLKFSQHRTAARLARGS